MDKEFLENTERIYVEKLDALSCAIASGDKASMEWAFTDVALALKELHAADVFTSKIDWSKATFDAGKVFSQTTPESLKYDIFELNRASGIRVRYENPAEPEKSPLVVSIEEGEFRPIMILDDMGIRTTVCMGEVDARKLSRYVAGVYREGFFGRPKEDEVAKEIREDALRRLKDGRDAPLPEDLLVSLDDEYPTDDQLTFF